MTESKDPMSRRRFLEKAGIGSAALLGGAATLLSALPSAEASNQSITTSIIQAAATAEALATTMYYQIINSSIYQDGLNGNANDQAYLVAGYEEELLHYQLLNNMAPAYTLTFYFPTGMFGGPETYATTVNTLVTLEDAFIAAYLIAVRDLPSSDYRMLAARIMGVEAEHRVLGRVIAADLNLHSTTGLSGKPEGVDGPSGFAANNLAYERTFNPPLSTITDVVNALGPFISPGTKGFSTTPYRFTDALKLHNVAPITLANTQP